MTDVRESLRALEAKLKRVRILAWLAVVVAAGSLAWGLLGSGTSIAEGKMWLVRDEQQRVRAMFGVSESGVGLTMYDSTGQMRLDLGLAPNGGPGLLLISPKGEPVATINLNTDAVPTLRLTDVASGVRVEVSPRPGATPVVVVAPGKTP